jgi:hypothetical protein
MKTRGQSLTESVVLLPLFLMFVFALLQIAQLGVAVVMTNYAASSIARTAAESNAIGGGSSGSVSAITQYQSNAEKFMVGGMNFAGVRACVSATPPTATITVRVRARIDAYPFFAQVLASTLKDTYADLGTGACPDMDSHTGFGPFNFTIQGGTYFFINGIARARLNYVS